MGVLLITGATGFIGKNLIDYIKVNHADYKIKTISQTLSNENSISYNDFVNNNYSRDFFDDVTDVIHLAAIAHKFSFDDEKQLQEINVNYPAKLFRVAAEKSLNTFVFLSSISVRLLEENIILETKQYAFTKKSAELELTSCARAFPETKLIILRPPMVYGKNAPGNFEKLIKLMKYPVGLPFGNMMFNKPSVHVKNLVSALTTSLKNHKADKGVFIYELADPFIVPFNEFLMNLNKAINGRAFIISFPLFLLSFLLKCLRRRKLFEKLMLTYTVSNKRFIEDTNWAPAIERNIMFKDL